MDASIADVSANPIVTTQLVIRNQNQVTAAPQMRRETRPSPYGFVAKGLAAG